ncbi:MAG: TonB-dependent receptor [Rhizobacter sp.]|nr:TonB-dependent receptor [Rhizobacter sp.]
MNRIPAPSRIAAAVALAVAQLGAQAQTAAPAEVKPAEVPAAPAAAASAPAETKPATASDGLQLDAVIVTGQSTRTSKMKSSVSISTIGAEQIEKTNATSSAELLRSVPGIRSESSGGEGNVNATSRGIPISAGGARYLQFQEDGLPILMFGDIAFGTPDQFLRADYNVERLEVVRGGTASTLTSNSPGGIINFLSKTGDEPGGAMALTAGLDYRQMRVDADYGAKLGPRTSLHIGGFQRIGEGARKAGFISENGGQIKANLTQQLDNGYVRVSLKSLDDRTPTYLPTPSRVNNGTIEDMPGVDGRSSFYIHPGLQRDVTLDRNGNLVANNPRDGLKVKSTAFGVETALKLGDGWTVDEKFRKSSNSGRFMGMFAANNATPYFNGVLFNTSIDSLDNLFNDLKLSKAFNLGESNKLTATGGVFTGVQDVALTWNWNTYLLDYSGQPVTAGGAPTTTPISTAAGTFGGCCGRTFDVQYTQLAPYAALAWEAGPFNIDASVRHDIQKASGYAMQDTADGTAWDPTTYQTVNYKVSHTSYSLGANFQFNRNLSVFGRVSNGVAFSADRLLYGTPLDGSVGINVNEIDQVEGGVKWRQGNLSAFVTVFDARTKESNFEATTQTFTSNKYKSQGIELEAAYSMGGLRLAGGATFTDAQITDSQTASQVGNKPRRQADLTYQLSPSYAIGDLELGAALVGTTKSFADDANTITMPGYFTVNSYLNYQLTPTAQLSLGVNNLFDKLAYTEAEGDGHAARALTGRSVKATVKYTF